MSGRYDWILFPLGLAAIALFVTAVWLDVGEPSRDIRYMITCETAAIENPGNAEERMAACEIEGRGRTSPSAPMTAAAKPAAAR